VRLSHPCGILLCHRREITQGPRWNVIASPSYAASEDNYLGGCFRNLYLYLQKSKIHHNHKHQGITPSPSPQNSTHPSTSETNTKTTPVSYINLSCPHVSLLASPRKWNWRTSDTRKVRCNARAEARAPTPLDVHKMIRLDPYSLGAWRFRKRIDIEIEHSLINPVPSCVLHSITLAIRESLHAAELATIRP
jgi:hypothetical protein